MKQRVISALIAALIAVPIFLLGGFVYKIGVLVLAVLGLKELIDIKETKRPLPFLIKYFSYLSLILTFTAFFNMYKMISFIFLLFLIPIIFYKNKEYNVEDAFFLITGIFLLGLAFNLLSLLRTININLLIYLLLVSMITDIFAYLTGMTYGKHKLCPLISPKKTWEGSIGGTIMALIICTFYYNYFIGGHLYLVILMTLVLSVVGQLGDLFFSSIKRYYDKKDFSNIMPGHGGILDRVDNLIFVLFAFIFFI